MSEFDSDYLRQLLQKMEVVEGERLEQQLEEGRDTIERVDRAIARRMRPDPRLLQLTPNEAVLADAESLSSRLDELYELRTTLCRRLEASELPDETVLMLMRSILAGIEHDIAHYREPDPPAQILADLLRQERMSRLMGPEEMAEAWRILFELQVVRSHWALAEDYLFHAVALTEDPTELVDRGVNFFQELLKLDDSDLEAGGLTREEVDRARWDLLKRVDEDSPGS